MDATSATAFVSTTVGDIGDVLTGVIPVILVVFAALVGLGIAIKYIRKWIGKRA